MDDPEEEGYGRRIDLQETAVQELRKGRELMAELSSLLRGTSWPQDDDRSELAGVYFSGIMRAFQVGIRLVMNSIGDSAADPRWVRGSSSSCGAGASDGGAARRRPNPPTRRERKRNISCSKTVVTESPFAGDQQWRKYGEKKISNSKNPRCYYRCVYGGCNAKLQVQQNDDTGNQQMPIMYQVTHNNEHTCKADTVPCASSLQAMLLTPPPGGSQFICFESGESAVPSSQDTNFAVLDTPTSTDDHTSSSSFPVIVSSSHPIVPQPPPTPSDHAFCAFSSPPSPPGPYYGHDASVY